MSSVRRNVTARYHSAWHKLRPLLQTGANVCTTDDHEYWNDFPFKPNKFAWPAIYWSDTVRRNIRREAYGFVQEAQQVSGARVFDIGSQLSVFVLETRLYRTQRSFARATDMSRLRQWVSGLQSPGVLVIGQPLLSQPVGRIEELPSETVAAPIVGAILGGPIGAIIGNEALPRGEISDHNLSYYTPQYRELVRALSNSLHDILVLSGDIHLGRIARIKVHKRQGTDPTRIYEVIASPLSRLDTGVIDSQNTRVSLRAKHPLFFPPDPGLVDDSRFLLGLTNYVRHVPSANGAETRNHFMTLSFTAGPEPNSVQVRVRAWMIGRPNSRNPRLPARLFTETFVLNAGRLPPDFGNTERRVTGVMANRDGDILALVNPYESWSPRFVHEADRDISNNFARYYISRDGLRTYIHVVRDPTRGITYLRANPNQESRDNLDNLPRFPVADWH